MKRQTQAQGKGLFMYKYIILSLITTMTLPAHASLKAKALEVLFKNEGATVSKSQQTLRTVDLPVSKQIKQMFSRFHLDPRVAHSGSVNRIVRDSFDNGSQIDAQLRVDFFRKKRVTFLETKLEKIDVNDSAFKSFVQDSVSVKRTRDGTVYIKHLIPDQGITDDLSTRFSNYYKSLIMDDYYDSKKSLLRRYQTVESQGIR